MAPKRTPKPPPKQSASLPKPSPKAAPPTSDKASKKPEPKNNCSLAPPSQAKWEKNGHRAAFTCKIFGIPCPQYRGYAVGKNHSKPWVLSPSKSTQAKFREILLATMARHGPQVQFNTSDKGMTTHIKILFYFPRPKHHYTLCHSTGKFVLNHNAPVWKTSTPDLDNLVKLVMDSIKGVAFRDDACVVKLNAEMMFDSTQKVWQSQQITEGCTILKIEQFTPNTFDPTCNCRTCCAHKATIAN